MPEQLRTLGEFGWLKRLRGRAGPWGPTDGLGLGEDTAALPPVIAGWLLATVDTLIEDIHFRTHWASFADIGHKALAVSLSDIAAMGGTPRWALVALGVPGTTLVDDLDALYGALGDLAQAHGVEVVGGDTTRSEFLLASTTVLGESDPARTLSRRGARPGDLVCVTGDLGLAAAGLVILETGAPVDDAVAPAVQRLLRPQPRLAAGRALAASGRVTACIDLSDGLSSDICRIAEESGVGARIDLAAVPCAPACRTAAGRLRGDALQWALEGGEDYELLFTLPPGAADDVGIALGLAGAGCIPVGEILPAAEGITARADGTARPLGLGFDHFRGRGE